MVVPIPISMNALYGILYSIYVDFHKQGTPDVHGAPECRFGRFWQCGNNLGCQNYFSPMVPCRRFLFQRAAATTAAQKTNLSGQNNESQFRSDNHQAGRRVHRSNHHLHSARSRCGTPAIVRNGRALSGFLRSRPEATELRNGRRQVVRPERCGTSQHDAHGSAKEGYCAG